ncbi:MAG: heme-binding domain-containing protein [Bacteroidota bacterium]
MKKVVKSLALSAAALFILIQFIQPERENPPHDPAKSMQSSLAIPANIQSLLERGCMDCHSNTTEWPLYSYIAPVSWLVSYDVEEGRKHFNMSEWEKYKFSKKANILGGIASTVKEKEMPLPKYIPLHPEANFTDAERLQLIEWAQSEAMKMMDDE